MIRLFKRGVYDITVSQKRSKWFDTEAAASAWIRSNWVDPSTRGVQWREWCEPKIKYKKPGFKAGFELRFSKRFECTASIAKEHEEELKQKLVNRRLFSDGKPSKVKSLNDLFDWRQAKWAEDKDLRQSSVTAYTHGLLWISRRFGHVPISEITIWTLDEIKRQMMQDLHPTTVGNYLVTFHSTWVAATPYFDLPAKPWQMFRWPRPAKEESPYFSKEVATWIVNQFKQEEPNKTFWLLARCAQDSAARLNELARATWDRVNLEGDLGSLFIPANIRKNKRDHTVYFSEETTKILRSHHQEFGHVSERVFPSVYDLAAYHLSKALGISREETFNLPKECLDRHNWRVKFRRRNRPTVAKLTNECIEAIKNLPPTHGENLLSPNSVQKTFTELFAKHSTEWAKQVLANDLCEWTGEPFQRWTNKEIIDSNFPLTPRQSALLEKSKATNTKRTSGDHKSIFTWAFQKWTNKDDIEMARIASDNQRLGFHAFRHGVGFQMAEENENPYDIAAVLGIDVATAIKVYIHTDAVSRALSAQRVRLAQLDENRG